ncbi:unnamed protein product [Phytophthora fragariaefolia]|uniref:Unnamed protein product n=1 Tax=Phytophthora fragariaefolia TaxID=1490495 RepID=A0A9W6YAR4_9STRA|nr:unnamed protein product [Phytophthora fragariaefolia]
MPRRKSTPSKRPLDAPPPQRSATKRAKRSKWRQPPPRREPLPLSSATNASDGDVLALQFPVASSLAPSLTVVCGSGSAPQSQIELTLVERDQVMLHLRGQEHSDADARVSLAELFPDTNEAWRPHVATLAERRLLSLRIDATRKGDSDHDWSFSFVVHVAWREYMEICSSWGLLPGSAAPRAAPMRAMHHVMIWLLKKTHGAQRELAEVNMTCRFRYWDEIEVLYNRFVGNNSAICDQFRRRTFAMPEIYAHIDVERQLKRDISEYEAAEAASPDLLPTLRSYQKSAVSWMLSREKATSQQDHTLPLCVSFSKAAVRNVQAYDPFCGVFYPSTSIGGLQLQQELQRPVGMNLLSVRGGILADEMGLGKTVEVIALVLCHRQALSRPRLLSTHKYLPDDESKGITDSTVACICGSTESHPMGYVQCDFCGTWHHKLCTGYIRNGECEDYEPRSHNIWDFESTISKTESTWSSGGFMCYHCQSIEWPSFTSRTTLIVSPEPIHTQWEHEISRHISAGAVSVMRYPGVRALRTRLEGTGPSAEWQVLASPGLVLARYDVVLTTYEALGADFRHVPTTEGKDRRASTRSQHKRYAFVSSPLVALHFWRICMDEAQVGVENTRLQAALTLSRLSSENRWVVTGTSFSSRVGELFGYLRFLRVSPYASLHFAGGVSDQNVQSVQAEYDSQEGADLNFFRESIEHNFAEGAVNRVLDLLLWSGQASEDIAYGGGILWRTGKKHVLDQLDLPPQKSEVIWCNFAAVERHFYDQQEKRIVSLVQQRQRQSVQSSTLIAREDGLWQDLLVLRQLCCHPQVGGARQAWGSGGDSSGGVVLTMGEFLQELLKKVTRECEDAQRQLIGAQNGLAALLVLDHDVSGAALKYMAQMSMIRMNWSRFRSDLLPRLHILQNLEKCAQQLYNLPSRNVQAESEVFPIDANANPKRVCLLPELPALEKRISLTGLQSRSANLRDEEFMAIQREYLLLGNSARHIRHFYLLQVDMMHTQAFNNFRQVFDGINEGQNSSSPKPEMLCTAGGWWSDALAIIEMSERDGDQQLVSRIQARLSGFGTRWGMAFCSQLVSTRSLRFLLARELELLAKQRRVLFKRLTVLSEGEPSDADIELSGNCAKCREGGTGPICAHCQLYKELDAYRQHFLGVDKTPPSKTRITDLFDNADSMEDSTITTKTSGGGSSVSLFIEVFKEISSCARNTLRYQQNGKIRASNIQTEMQGETEFWMKLQREWQAAKKLIQAQHQRFGALDELAMASSQLRLRQPGEPPACSKAEHLYKLERAEVPLRAAELEAERVAADLDLQDKMAQLRYLLELQGGEDARQAQYSQQNEAYLSARTVQPICAVCLQEFTQRRAVLPCAHIFCTACISNLTGDHGHARKNIRCPTCRRISRVESVTVVVEAKGTTVDSTPPLSQGQTVTVPEKLSHHHIGGSLGSKLDALLRRVDMLRQENPGVKCLLFSQWSQMLELVVQALPRLGVRCFMYGTKRQLPTLLSQFKTCSAPCVLALPFKVGANGLNIVEATEILLIEPLLSTSIEAQAVNRVHRLGQTRQTRVHRFIVRSSIEEGIYRLGHKHKPGTSGAVQTTSGSSGESDGDDKELQRLGVAPGRKEQEKLTIQNLHDLLHGSSHSVDDVHQSLGATAVAFWNGPVMLNGKTISRRVACAFLERRHATELREGNQAQYVEAQEPHTRLFDRPTALLVAEELLSLSSPLDNNDGEHFECVDPQILQHHFDRVQEELREWKATQQRLHVA